MHNPWAGRHRRQTSSTRVGDSRSGQQQQSLGRNRPGRQLLGSEGCQQFGWQAPPSLGPSRFDRDSRLGPGHSLGRHAASGRCGDCCAISQ